MAVDAGQGLVRGVSEQVLVDIQLDLLPLPLHGQGGLAVAGKAFFRGLPRYAAGKHQERSGYQKTGYRFHRLLFTLAGSRAPPFGAAGAVDYRYANNIA
jgi:hypothetical protein